MAASAASPGLLLSPSYAVVCSFLERYGALLDLPELTFPQLERCLRDTSSSVPKLLVDLHMKLLRKIGKSVSAERWEKHLVKICQEFNTTWAWELEKNGYKDMSVECKTGILKYLCECQFDDNVKFKTAINEEDPDKMRLQPIGRDKDGQMYWFQLDQDNNVRVYLEELDDLDGSSWKCIVRTRHDLAQVLALLKTQIDPELLAKEKDAADGEEKKDGDGVKKSEEFTTDEETDKDPSSSIKTESSETQPPKNDTKSNVTEAKSPLNGHCKDESEPADQSDKVISNSRVVENEQTIKEEPVAVTENKIKEPVPTAEGPVVHIKPKAEQSEETRRNAIEEHQRSLKIDQQAKIPLKKRGMKLSEDFDKSSGTNVITQSPSITNFKDPAKVVGTSVEKPGQNDHVNGNAHQTVNKDFQSESSSKEQQPTQSLSVAKIIKDRNKDIPSAEQDSLDEKRQNSTLDKNSTEEQGSSNQSSLVHNLVDEKVLKEITVAPGEKVQNDKSSHKSSSPQTEGLASKDLNSTLSKSSDRKELDSPPDSKLINEPETKTVEKTDLNHKTEVAFSVSSGDSCKSKEKDTLKEDTLKMDSKNPLSSDMKSDKPHITEQESSKQTEKSKSVKDPSMPLTTSTKAPQAASEKDGIQEKKKTVPEQDKKEDSKSKVNKLHDGTESHDGKSKDRELEAGDDVSKPMEVYSKADVSKPMGADSKADVSKPMEVDSKADVSKPMEVDSKADVSKPEPSAPTPALEGGQMEDKTAKQKKAEKLPKDIKKSLNTAENKMTSKDSDKKPTQSADKQTPMSELPSKVEVPKSLSSCSPPHKTSSKDGDKVASKESEKAAIKESDKASSKESDKSASKESEKAAGKESNKVASKESDKAASKESDKAASKESDKAASKESDKATSKESGKATSKESDKAASKESDKATSKESGKAASKESDKAASKESDKVASKESHKTASKEREKAASKEREKATSKDVEKAASKESEKAASKESEKAASKESEKAASKEREKATSKDVEKAASKESDKAASKESDKAASKESEKAASKESEKAASKEGEKAASKESAKVASKEGEQAASKEGETMASKEGEKAVSKESAKVTYKKSEKVASKEGEKAANKDSDKAASNDSDKVTSKESDKEASKESEKEASKEGETMASKESDQGLDKKSPENNSGGRCELSKESATTEKPGEVSKAGNEVEGPDGSKVSDSDPHVAKDEEDPTKQKEDSDSEPMPQVRRGGARTKAKPRRRVKVLIEEKQADSESDTNVGRSLRRSARISRPTQKAVYIQDRKVERQQTDPPPEKLGEKGDGEKEEEEDDEEGKVVRSKPKEKKPDQEGQSKSKGRKRRKIQWSRARRKKRGSEDDDGSEGSGSVSSDEDETEEEEDDSDEDYKVERGKKRRNQNRDRRSSDSSTSSDDDLPPNDEPCKHCGLPNHPELILLCDSCDNGYHTACLRPPLMIIPDGEWFCPPCQHKQLCDKLEEQLLNLDTALKKKERAERRKERLVYVGISVENIITPSVEAEEVKEEPIVKEKKEVKRSKSWGRRSTRAKKSISYRFDEFDEAIEEAIEEDIKEAEGGGAGRGKDMANITGHNRGKDISTILQAGEGQENGCPPRPGAGPPRRKKRRRLNDLDSDSTVEEEESEDEFRLSDSSEEEEYVLSDQESEAADSNDSDFASGGGARRKAARPRVVTSRQRRSARRRRRPRGYSDEEEEEETDEDEEEEIVTAGSSEYSDSDLDVSMRRSRRSHKRKVNYCETSESDGSRASTNRDKMKSRRPPTSSDSEASDSEEDTKERRGKRRASSPPGDSRQRKRLTLKRRRTSEDSDGDSDDSGSSEEDRPVRKRVNRIDSDDSDEEEEEAQKKGGKGEEVAAEAKGPSAAPSLDANKQSPMKSLEGLVSRPPGASGLMAHLEPKNVAATTGAATGAATGAPVPVAPNGLGSQEPQDEDEDDLLGVTDLVDYVCNSEDL